MNQNAFHDLNIDSTCELNDELWNCLYEYETRVVAINQTIDCTEVSRKRKKGEKQEDAVPEPKEVKVPDDLRGKIIVLSRLTVKFSDASQWYRISKSPNLKKYHVLAAIPMSGDALLHCCSTGDVDIITFEAEERPCWRMSRKFYKMALSKNVFFELNYGPVILNVSSRKNVIQAAQIYRTFGKSKNIIVSSSLTFPFNIRSPFDIMNLCGLFGLNMGEAKCAILNNPKFLLLRAASRLQGKAVFKVTKKEQEETDSSSDEELDNDISDNENESMEIN